MPMLLYYKTIPANWQSNFCVNLCLIVVQKTYTAKVFICEKWSQFYSAKVPPYFHARKLKLNNTSLML